MFQKSSSNESGPGSPPMKQEWQILEKVATASVTEQRKARRWGIFFGFNYFLSICDYCLFITKRVQFRAGI